MTIEWPYQNRTIVISYRIFTGTQAYFDSNHGNWLPGDSPIVEFHDFQWKDGDAVANNIIAKLDLVDIEKSILETEWTS